MARKKLAVVVPMYNIEEFLGEALDSLLKQGVDEDDLQVILVDDGSADGTFDIAEAYVEKYPKIFEAHKFENAGLGAARNRGTRLADAEFITYVDPDDIITDGSYSYMLNTIEKSGSDIITGHVRRFDEQGRVWVPELHQRSILGDFTHTNLEEHPELVWDASSWNKLYRLSFLRENALYFPEGVLYEDFPMVNPAFAKADGIDVITKVVYMWRVRQGSITNMSTGAKATRDRIKVNQIALEGLNKYNAPYTAKGMLIKKALNMGIIAMLRKEHYDLIPLDEREALFSELQEYLALIPDDQMADTRFENQVYFRRVKQLTSQEEFDQLTSAFLKNETVYKGEWVDGNWTLSSSISDVRKIATSEDFKVNSKVETVKFDEDNLYLTGHVLAEYSDMSNPSVVKNVKVSIWNNENELVADNVGHVEMFENKNITAKFGYNPNHFEKNGADFNYDYSSYKITMPLDQFMHKVDYMYLTLTMEVDGQEIVAKIEKPEPGAQTRPEKIVSRKLSAAFGVAYDTTNWVMQIQPAVNIAMIKFEAGHFVSENAYKTIYITKKGKKHFLEKNGSRVLFPANLSKNLAQYDKNNIGDWRFMTTNGEVTAPVYLEQDPIQLPHDVFSQSLVAKKGVAAINLNWVSPKITNAVLENDTLILDIELFGWEKEAIKVDVIADSQVDDVVWSTEKRPDGLYRLTLPLTLGGFGEKTCLNFQVKMQFMDGYVTSQPLKWGAQPFDLEGKVVTINNVSWEFRRVVRNSGGFAIKRSADREYREPVGGFERFIETEYEAWLSEPLLDNHIMMSSFWGRNNTFNDNPEAMYQYVKKNYPNMVTVIVLRDVIREYPEFENAKVISYGTKDYWYYLAHAKYFVNNVNYVEEQRVKRDGQIEVQTMHGTPLKTLGFEVLGDWTDQTYNAVRRKNSNWDYLLTPSDWVSEYAKKVFCVDPIIVNSGYPRNDKILATHSENEIVSIKQQMGLPLDKKIVAFTPTWRNKENTDISEYLDVQSFYDAIPDDTFVILKNHHYEIWTGLEDKFKDKFAYAAENTSIEDLYIVADALITDYSSVMFDYSLLKKPMMFYAFDYEQYTVSRGINFDFKSEAPGAFVETQKDLEKWLNHTEDIQEKFANEIKQFGQKFIKYDLGNASEIAVETMLGNDSSHSVN